uniref:Acetyltransferase (GNAT) domain-containing protein n=1 Tax=Candidatus Kentrum sp. UNK TaxID=2126344 RepID=A0A450ZYK0_9GAMM|nr:MAG: hypothetical protein BECKUNK1418G_GA0071005_100534 [Candidatus Kentron sp. UNK]VFK68613.1 MAG: hypothetical protein BECKUNK1418H_GA0071006_100434 [Candidatus Kentron sp. UNK]
MHVIDFEPEHLSALRIREETHGLSPAGLAAYSMTLKNGGLTMKDGEEILCCAGVTPLWRGVGVAWAFVDAARPRRRAPAFHRSIVFYLHGIFSAGQYRRIQTTCHARNAAARRWLRMIGFREECVLARYAPNGEAHVLYAFFGE